MLLPAQYAWFEPALIATMVVFIIDLVGNSIWFRQPLPWRSNERDACSPSCSEPLSISATATCRCQ